MGAGMSERLFCVNLNCTAVDLMQIDNRRFMYHPDGWLILGAEDTVSGKKQAEDWKVIYMFH